MAAAAPIPAPYNPTRALYYDENAMRLRKVDPTKSSPGKKDLHTFLSSRLIGQPQVVEAAVDLIQRYFAPLPREAGDTKPLGSMIMLGPTGVGKTHLVELLAKYYFGSTNAFLKIDCAEYQHSHEIAKLLGSPPGYLGHKETDAGLSQKRLNANQSAAFKFNLVLFDEIEKANDAIEKLLLGILDKGVVTLGDNTRTVFDKSFIFLTSNCGSKELAETAQKYSFVHSEEKHQSQMEIYTRALRRKFAPEFLNRIDKKIVFSKLSDAHTKKVVGVLVSQFGQLMLEQKDIYIDVTPDAIAEVARIGFSARDNARALVREFDKRVKDAVASLLGNGEISTGSYLRVHYNGSDWVYQAAHAKGA